VSTEKGAGILPFTGVRYGVPFSGSWQYINCISHYKGVLWEKKSTQKHAI